MNNQKRFLKVEVEREILGGWSLSIGRIRLGDYIIRESVYIKIWRWKIKLWEKCYIVPVYEKEEND